MAYLRGYLSSSATTIPVNDTTAMPVNGGVIQIESEVIRYETATDIALLGCVRGYQNTSNAAHDDETPIDLLTVIVPTFQPHEFYGSGVPTDNLTGVAIANVGDRYTDSDSGDTYINTDNSETPAWVRLSDANDPEWGQITGDLEDQTDLQDALDEKLSTFPPVVASDPVAPSEGDIWFRSDTNEWRGFDGTDSGTFTFTPDA